MSIYLDYAATTPVDPNVALKMQTCLTLEGCFANPSSPHLLGQQARQLVENARQQVADLIGAEAEEIIWTSGATESDNLAIKGAAHLYQRKGKHIVTMKTEHKAVLDTCQFLEKEGYQVTYLSPDQNGQLSLATLTEALREDTILVSIMQVNNETGVIQDIAAIADIIAARGILFHVDAAQSAGKIPINVRDTSIDLMSFSAHKLYGPKGIGALYLRKKPRVRVEPLIHGGGHEKGMRSGTLPTHQIVGMGEAFALAKTLFEQDAAHIQALHTHFLACMKAIPNFRLNVPFGKTIPNILSVRFDGCLADMILSGLPELAVSTASACQGKGAEGSYVLRAMGYPEESLKSTVRFSFGRFTRKEDIDQVASWLKVLIESNGFCSRKC